MSIEVIFSPGQQPIEMSREQLEELIRDEKVGMEAVLRDEWTHPNWKPVFRIPRFRRAVAPDSMLGRQWQREKAEARRKGRERAKAMWPNRFDSPLETTLGVEKWENIGWDHLAASRLSLFAPMFGYAWIMTFQWSKEHVLAECRSDKQHQDGRIPTDTLPSLLADVVALPGIFGRLGHIEPYGLDGYTFVHRFACGHTSIATTWWVPNEQDHPQHIRLLAAYADCARQLGFAAARLT